MKKNFKLIYIFIILLFTLAITGCVDDSSKKVSIIIPTGTPSLGVASAINNSSIVEANIVSGSDPLVAAFTNGSYDIVVAPVNLGAKLYNANANFEYVLYKTIVWGNYYLVANEEILSIKSLDGKKVLVFGKNSTPDVVLQTLAIAKGIDVEFEYVNDVSTANSYLLTGKADIIVSAEPSLTKISSNKSFYTFDLQQAWKDLTGSYSLPQAGIFVKKSLKNNQAVLNVLNKMKQSVDMATTNPNELVKDAVSVDSNLATIGQDTLEKAIGNCNLRVEENDQEAIEFYFEKVIALGIGVTVGGKLPDEAFYY